MQFPGQYHDKQCYHQPNRSTMSILLLIVLILVLLTCGTSLCFILARSGRFRFQFSLRSLFVVIAVVALVLGLIRTWPSHIITLPISRIEAKPGLIDTTRDAVDLDVSQRWGHTTIRVTPLCGFDETSTAELFWLESGSLRHVAIADKGQVSAASFSRPNEWPFLIGAVEYHAKATRVVGHWILPDGREGGHVVLYDPNAPALDGGVEKWGQAFLESVREK
jgi:hypothetical protein